MRAIPAGVFVCLLVAGSSTGHAENPVPKYFVDVAVPSLDAVGNLAAAGFDIAGVNHETMKVGVVVTQEELKRLQALGWPLTIVSNNFSGRAVVQVEYTDPQEMSAFVDAVVAAHPDLAEKIVLQPTLFEGQTQYAVHITKDVGIPNERPAFEVDGQHHAREVMCPEITKDIIDYLTSRYATDAQVRHWVDNINIWVIPIVNPDGAMYAFTTDDFWRKNRHPGCPVDNNRNYPGNWSLCNGSSDGCDQETYRGESPASEPETRGVMQVTADTHPFFTLTYHTYANLIMYPYGCGDPDEMAAFDEVAQGLKAVLEDDHGVPGQYKVGPEWSTLYVTDGSTKDTQYMVYGAYAFQIEATLLGFDPDYYSWHDVTVRRQRTGWMYFLDKTLDAAQIRGTVTDAETGLPLPATMALQEVTLTHGESPRRADPHGHYHLLVHSNGTYHVSASYPGYCPVSQEAVVGTGPAVRDAALIRRLGAPQSFAAAAAGDNAIDLSWQAVAGADQYRVLRSLFPGGPYAEVATVPAGQLTYRDGSASGAVTNYYVVRAVRGCDSDNSSEAHAVTTGVCTAGPTFAGVAAVTNPQSPTCALNVSWPSAASRCGGSVTYRIYRSTTTPVVPTPGNLVASGLSGNSFTDRDALASGGTYSYLVRAVDVGNGGDDGNSVSLSATPTGPDVVGTWTDDAGDTGPARLTWDSAWTVQPTGGKTGPKVYRAGPMDNWCGTLTTPPIALPDALAHGPVLTFATKYDLSTFKDAGIVEVATGPLYEDWTYLPMNYPDGLAYFQNKCHIYFDGAHMVFSHSNASPAYPAASYTGTLPSQSGGTIKLRWRFSTAPAYPGAPSQGWWVDDIAVSGAIVPSVCSAGAPANAKEPSPDGSMKASRVSSGSGVQLVYLPGCGALDNAVYWGTGPIDASIAWSNVACAVGNSGQATFDPGDPAPGSFFYFVIVGQSATKEGSYGSGATGERPEAVGVGACDKPQDLTGTCP